MRPEGLSSNPQSKNAPPGDSGKRTAAGEPGGEKATPRSAACRPGRTVFWSVPAGYSLVGTAYRFRASAQALLQGLELLLQFGREMGAELGEVGFDLRENRFPALGVHAEQHGLVFGRDI